MIHSIQPYFVIDLFFVIGFIFFPSWLKFKCSTVQQFLSFLVKKGTYQWNSLWQQQEGCVSHRVLQNTQSMEGSGKSPGASPAAKPRCADSNTALPDSDKSKLAAVLKLHPYWMCILHYIPIVEGLSNTQIPNLNGAHTRNKFNDGNGYACQGLHYPTELYHSWKRNTAFLLYYQLTNHGEWKWLGHMINYCYKFLWFWCCLPVSYLLSSLCNWFRLVPDWNQTGLDQFYTILIVSL